jgi:hypothetical protein
MDAEPRHDPAGGPVRVAVWSGPRNLSTAMMRAWENREDCLVVDEPLYASYLARTGLDHPGREEVLAAQPTDPAAAVRRLLRPLPAGVRVQYAKQMAHHLAHDAELTWTTAFRNVLLIRDPAEVVASYVRSRESCEPADIGVLQQVRLLDAWAEPPPVIDAADFLRDPEGTCAGCASGSRCPSAVTCSPGRPGPATPTASGRRTGMTRCGGRRASRPGAPVRSPSASTTRR